MKLEDVQKALSLVDKVQPAPDKFKAGLEAITAKDSDGDADLHRVRPHGRPRDRDPRLRAGRRIRRVAPQDVGRQARRRHADDGRLPHGRRRPGAPGSPRAVLFPGIHHEGDLRLRRPTITIEVAKGGMVKSRTFQGGLDFQGGFGGMGGAPKARVTAPVVFVGYGISRAVRRLRRAQGAEPQGQDRPPAQRRARPGRPQVPAPGQEGAQGQVLPGGAPGRHDGHDDAGGPQRFNKLDRDRQARAGGHRPGLQHGQRRRHLQRPVHGPQAQRRAADRQPAPPEALPRRRRGRRHGPGRRLRRRRSPARWPTSSSRARARRSTT
ncbi:MAG: hypothetical protein M0C28_46385 [Candidatus Moduliflexus flocculans]|nr:hypothetical protein [Candidatus Moduliflexus flocculans]